MNRHCEEAQRMKRLPLTKQSAAPHPAPLLRERESGRLHNPVVFAFALLFSLFIHAPSFAQDGLKPENIEVVSDFNPLIADAVKINFPATLPDREASGKLELFYETPVQLLSTPFSPTPLKPIAIAKEKPEQFPMSYFKVGFGTQLSPLFEALWNDGKYEKLHYGAYFRHFSSRGSKINHQDFNTNHVSVFGNAFMKKARFDSKIDYHRDGVVYYGYDHSDTTFKKKDIKQFFNDFVFSNSITNTKNPHEFNYKADLDFGYFSDKFDRSEFYFRGAVQMDKIFRNKHFVTLKLAEDFNVFNSEPASQVGFSVPRKRNIFTVKPVYEYNDRTWRIWGGVDLTWENNIFHLFPETGMERSLWDNYIISYSTWRMELNRTSYKTLTADNPWIGNDFELRNTWYEDRSTGLKGTVKNFSYDVRFGQRLVRRMPIFVNDTTDMKTFVVQYDPRTNILTFHAELFYHAMRDLDFSLTFDFFDYEMDDVAQPWHLPNFMIDFNTRYTIKKKVFLTFDFLVRDGVKALLPGNETKELNPTADINIGATYKFSKHFSFFCNLNNLASIKYEKYYLYPSYGFNGMIGAIFTY